MAAKLYIDSKPCDLSKKEEIALTFSVHRLTEIRNRQGHYSNTFKLPLTSRNVEIYGHPDQLVSTDGRRWQSLEARIEVDGVIVVFGKASLEGVSDFMEVSIIGGLADWVDDIRDKKLEDLDLSDLNHEQSPLNIHNRRFNDYTDHLVYPDIDYGLFTSFASDIPHHFLKPAVFGRTIFERIFTDAGWTISSNEINATTLSEKIILPYSKQEQKFRQAWKDDYAFKAQIEPKTMAGAELVGSHLWRVGFDDDSTGDFFDTGNHFTLGDWDDTAVVAKYVPGSPVKQTFTATLTFIYSYTISSTPPIIRVGFHSSEHEDGSEVEIKWTPGGFQDDVEATVTISTTVEEFLQQTVTIYYQAITEFELVSGHLTTEISDTQHRWGELDVAANLPDMNQSDFVRYWINAFSALIIPDATNKTVQIKMFDEIDQETPVDWSRKIDLTDEPVISSDYGEYKRDNLLQYDNDTGDSTITEANEDLGEHVITNTDRPVGERVIYKAPFSLSKRRYTRGGIMRKGYIGLNEERIGNRNIRHHELTITDVSGGGLVTVTSGARDLVGVSKIALRNVTGGDLRYPNEVGAPSISDQTFTIASIDSDTEIQLEESFGGTTDETGGTVYTGLFDRTLTTTDPEGIEVGTTIIFTDLDGIQTIHERQVNQHAVTVTAVKDGSITISGNVAGGTPATEGSFIFVRDYLSGREVKPRIGVHVIEEASVNTIDINGQASVTQGSEVYFDDLYWPALTSAYWVKLSGIIIAPQVVKMLMRLSATDINQINFGAPHWVQHFNSFFYLSQVEQYDPTRVDSTAVELVKLPA